MQYGSWKKINSCLGGSHYQCNWNAKIKKFKLNLKRETSANNGILPIVEIVKQVPIIGYYQ